MKIFWIVLLFTTFLITPAFAARYTTVTIVSPVVAPYGTALVSASIDSYHINVHKITTTSDTGNAKGRVDIYKTQALQLLDRVYSRAFTGSFADPDGVIRVEGFVFTYEDADAYSHPPSRKLHVLFSNTSNQAHTYTVNVTYEADHSDVLDVRRFGAIGDGVANDTVAIQNAINEGFVQGRTIFFPEGKYRITASLRIDMAPLFREELWIEGVGPRSIIINDSASTGNPALVILNKSQFHVRKLAIVGRPDVENEGIFIGGANRSGYGTLDDLDLYPNGVGIHFQDTNTVAVDRVRYFMGGSLTGYVVGAPTANFKHAILADGATPVNEIYIRALFSTGYASYTGSPNAAAIRWNTDSVSSGVRIFDSSLEGSVVEAKRAIDFRNVFLFTIEDTFLENAEVTLVSSRHGFLSSNDGGSYKIGDGSAASACNYITAFAVSGEGFVADAFNEAIRVVGGIFDADGYDNQSSQRVSLNVYGGGSLIVPDELGAKGIKERGRDVSMGEWTPVPYDGANFSSSAGAFIVDEPDILNYSYTLIGKTITVNFTVQQATLSGSSTPWLAIKIPGGHLASKRSLTLGAARNFQSSAGGESTGMEVLPGGDRIFLYRGFIAQSTNWQPVTDEIDLSGSITFQIQ